MLICIMFIIIFFKMSLEITNELSTSTITSFGFIFQRYIISCYHGFKETENNIYVSAAAAYTVASCSSLSAASSVDSSSDALPIASSDPVLAANNKIHLKINFIIPDYDIIVFSLNHHIKMQPFEYVFDVRDLRPIENSSNESACSEPALIQEQAQTNLTVNGLDVEICDIVNMNVKLLLAPMMPVILCRLVKAIPFDQYHGLSGSPLLLNKSIVGMVMSYNTHDNVINVLPIYIIHRLILNNTSKIYGLYPGAQRVKLTIKKKTYNGLLLSENVCMFHKSPNSSSKLKRNTIIVGINNILLSETWCIYDDVMNFPIDVYAYISLNVDYTKISYVNCSNDSKEFIQQSIIYPYVLEDIYNVRLSDVGNTITFNGLKFAELSEEFILDCAKEGKILYGNIFENYHLCVPHIRKYVILVGCGKQHFNEVFVPYKNGYYVRVVDKISRFKVVDLASFHTYLTQIVESSQKSFQLFFNPDDLDIKKESLKICL